MENTIQQALEGYALLVQQLEPVAIQLNEGLREGWTPLILFGLMNVAAFLALAAAIIVKPQGRLRIKWGRKTKMYGPEKEKFEKQLIGGALTDILEEAEIKGAMTKFSKNMWYRRFANILNMPDLLPQKIVQKEVATDILHPDVAETEGDVGTVVLGKTLKERIKQRVQLHQKPVPLPDREKNLRTFMADRKLSHKVA